MVSVLVEQLVIIIITLLLAIICWWLAIIWYIKQSQLSAAVRTITGWTLSTHFTFINRAWNNSQWSAIFQPFSGICPSKSNLLGQIHYIFLMGIKCSYFYWMADQFLILISSSAPVVQWVNMLAYLSVTPATSDDLLECFNPFLCVLLCLTLEQVL